jgi:hypothetical protein
LTFNTNCVIIIIVNEKKEGNKMGSEDIKLVYDKTCFDLKERKNELEKIKLDIFVLNPRLSELIDEIVFLEKEKSHLEDLMNE